MTTNATREHCIDAETLAAWADAGLSATDTERVELHLSNCERCQGMLAAFVRSEPAAAVVLPFWNRRPVRWAAASLATAAAVVLMVWTEGPTSSPKEEATLASNESVPAGLSDTKSLELESVAPTGPPVSEAPVSSPVPPPDLAGVPPSLPVSPPAAEPPPSKTEERRTDSRPAPATAPPPPPPAAAQTPVVGGVLGRRAAADTAQANEPREAAVAEKKVLAELAPIEIIAPGSLAFASRTQPAAQAGAARRQAAGLGGGSEVPSRWRILEGTRVERSIDAGVTWTPVNITVVPSSFLTAGAAASETVCWLVGQGGAVFVSSDGVTFEQVASPGPAAITSVEAVDALHATVVTVDGRTFTTVDGGATWQERTGRTGPA